MRLFALLFAIASLVFLTGCDSEGDGLLRPEPGTLSGTVRMDPDLPGTIDGTVIQLFTFYDDVLTMRPDRVVGVDRNGSFEFRDVYPGTYYLGLWKDCNQDGLLNSGDYTVNRGSRELSACCVTAGSSTQVCPCIYVIP